MHTNANHQLNLNIPILTEALGGWILCPESSALHVTILAPNSLFLSSNAADDLDL
jgi:hypothetical protein